MAGRSIVCGQSDHEQCWFDSDQCICECHRKPKPWFYVNIYEIDRRYGGPEEGGWWYDWYSPDRSVEIRTRNERDAHEIADKLREVFPGKGYRFSMAPRDTDYLVEVSKGLRWPSESKDRPHYE